MVDQVLYCRDHVHQPYSRVRDLLLSDPHLVVRRATAADVGPAAELHVRIVEGDVATEAVIEIVGVASDDTYHRPVTTISMEWRTRKSPRILPELNAELRLFAVSDAETQLELHGTYHPPTSKHGDAIDTTVAHGLAETSVRRFLQQLAGWLREQLGPPHATAAVAQPPAGLAPALDVEC